MPIVENDTLEFPTCPTIIRPPVDEVECAKYPSFEELTLQQETAEHGCTIRSAQGWAIKTVAEIATQCEVV